jgi:DNA-binding transcriptional regulator YdaS (Cro superfamily)
VPDLYVRTLVRAAEIVGGEQELAIRLKVTPSHLALWLRGIEVPPMQMFLNAVDIVTEHDVSTLSSTLADTGNQAIAAPGKVSGAAAADDC